jgi:hypothetical protein
VRTSPLIFLLPCFGILFGCRQLLLQVALRLLHSGPACICLTGQLTSQSLLDEVDKGPARSRSAFKLGNKSSSFQVQFLVYRFYIDVDVFTAASNSFFNASYSGLRAIAAAVTQQHGVDLVDVLYFISLPTLGSDPLPSL